ncbi:MAG: hypothetical protein ACLP00_06300 [Terracidiphilus sp.]
MSDVHFGHPSQSCYWLSVKLIATFFESRLNALLDLPICLPHSRAALPVDFIGVNFHAVVVSRFAHCCRRGIDIPTKAVLTIPTTGYAVKSFRGFLRKFARLFFSYLLQKKVDGEAINKEPAGSVGRNRDLSLPAVIRFPGWYASKLARLVMTNALPRSGGLIRLTR